MWIFDRGWAPSWQTLLTPPKANSVSVECELAPPPCIYMCSRPCLTGSPGTPNEHAWLRNERASPDQRAGPNAASETDGCQFSSGAVAYILLTSCTMWPWKWTNIVSKPFFSPFQLNLIFLQNPMEVEIPSALFCCPCGWTFQTLTEVLLWFWRLKPAKEKKATTTAKKSDCT